MLSNKASCNILANILGRSGVEDVILSPGSRNAPLIIAFDACNNIRKHVVIDERSAAFMALGLSQCKRKPVAIVCTSGTALLNYAPAIAEAYYQGIPLIVISADRPVQWIDQDDSQTLRQHNILANIVKRSYDLPDMPSGHKDAEWYANRIANDAIATATEGKPGPVHVNVQLDEPLVSQLPADTTPSHWQTREIHLMRQGSHLDRTCVEKLANEAYGKKILIIAGFSQPDHRLNHAVRRMLGIPGVTLMCETISNLHIDSRYCAVDRVLTEMTAEERHELQPDIVISIGGALISRIVKSWLRECDSTIHWHFGISGNTIDCFKKLSLRVECNPATSLGALAGAMRRLYKHRVPDSCAVYARRWDEIRQRALASHTRYIKLAPWSDLKAMGILFESVPDTYNLQLSNGTSVRYAQLFTAGDNLHACFCNRGVSGIDGSTSTAIGASMAYSGTTLLVAGDMSMAYDIGALANRYISPRLKIAVLNNGGGGIFRFISSTGSLDCRETYFCAPPCLPLKQLSEAYGFRYFKADNADRLESILPLFHAENKQPAILEIITPPETSGSVLRDYMSREKA